MRAESDDFLVYLLRHQTEIKAFIGSLLRDRQSRDDVFQDVAMILWQRFDEFDRSRSFTAWARGIAARKVLHEIRDRRRQPVLLDAAAFEALILAFERLSDRADVRRDALDRCLSGLPATSRKLLELKYESGWNAEKIAAEMGETVANVHQLLSRLRGRLLDCVQRRLGAAGGVVS